MISESTGLRRPITVVALVACLATGALAVRNGLIEAAYRENPQAIVAIGGGDARVRGELINLHLQQAKLRVAPALLADAQGLLRLAPLSDIPLAVAGGANLRAGQLNEAIVRLEEARRRNPRNRSARLFLLEAYLRSMKVAQAGSEIVTLGRLLGESRPILVPVVASALVDPVVGPQLKSAVRSDPQLRSSVALAMVALNATPTQVIEVGGIGPTLDPADKAWRGALLQKMVTSGQVTESYRLWRRFAAPGKDDASASFGAPEGLPPFDWTYLATGDGVAEPSRHGALDITFYNRNSVSLARKLVTLAPGRWRLEVAVEGGPTRGQEPLAARIGCASDNVQLARIPFTIDRGGLMRAFASFTVPASCSGQWITIDGTAQEFPTPRTVSVTSLTFKSFK